MSHCVGAIFRRVQSLSLSLQRPPRRQMTGNDNGPLGAGSSFVAALTSTVMLQITAAAAAAARRLWTERNNIATSASHNHAAYCDVIALHCRMCRISQPTSKNVISDKVTHSHFVALSTVQYWYSNPACLFRLSFQLFQHIRDRQSNSFINY